MRLILDDWEGEGHPEMSRGGRLVWPLRLAGLFILSGAAAALVGVALAAAILAVVRAVT